MQIRIALLIEKCVFFFIESPKWTNIWFFRKLRCLLTLACSNNCFAKQWFIELYEKKVRAQGVTEILRTILYGFFSSNSLVNKEFCVDFVNKEIFSLLNFFTSNYNECVEFKHQHLFSDSQQGLLIKIFGITKIYIWNFLVICTVKLNYRSKVWFVYATLCVYYDQIHF